MRVFNIFGFLLCLALFRPSFIYGQEFLYERDYLRVLARSRNVADSFHYNRLLSRFLVNDPALSVKEMLYLMVGYTGLPEYKPYVYRETEKKIVKLNDQSKYKEALQLCDTFLSQYPLSQMAIIEKAYAFYKLKLTDSAQFYKEQFARIMAAMDWSADGLSPETAMFSIGPYDGQNFVDKYYHADPGRINTIENKAGDLCAVVEMFFKKEGVPKKMNFYFNIQHAVNTQAGGDK